MNISDLRKLYHQHICDEIIRFGQVGESTYPNFADRSSTSSREIALGVVRQLGCKIRVGRISGQTVGKRFEAITKEFLEEAFQLLYHLRPGDWHYSLEKPISEYDQYAHLKELADIILEVDALATSLGADYIIKPDIVIGRMPISDEEINQNAPLIDTNEDFTAKLTPLRAANMVNKQIILHASISCKWTIRSDRAQNVRAEALNLIRNRKGKLPHTVALTAEPMPTRIASLALGTGDLDCVYHFALSELDKAVRELDNQDQLEMLEMLIEGRRLRDISDLPFDLAI